MKKKRMSNKIKKRKGEKNEEKRMSNKINKRKGEKMKKKIKTIGLGRE